MQANARRQNNGRLRQKMQANGHENQQGQVATGLFLP
jgi:hypothetical protein